MTDEYVPKSYRFERDLDGNEVEKRVDSVRFSEESNEHFVYEDIEHLFETADGRVDLADMLRLFFKSQKQRLRILEDYSRGNNTGILTGRRRLDVNRADKRVRHPFGGYISEFLTGFVVGKPVTISSSIKETDDLEDLERTHKINDVETLNYDLAYDASRLGRAFELHLRENGSNDDKIYLIEPKEMFVIRSVDVTKKMLAAVHCPIYNGRVYLTAYTDSNIYTFEPFKLEAVDVKEPAKQSHLYEIVPVVEWWNNRYRTGDFENIISIIDVYDSAQSDTANYMSDLNDATLFISGDIKATGYEAKDWMDMKDANLIVAESALLPDGSESKVTAQYLYKQYDVAGTEAYKTRLESNIHKFSKVPDLSDETFGTSSGIALQYKLINLRQIQVTKQSYFTKALQRRYEIIERIHRNVHDVEIDSKALEFTFHPNLPEDIWAEVTAYINAGGELSQETLRALASFVDHDTEKKRLLEEYQERMAQGYTQGRLDGVADDTGADDAEINADGATDDIGSD